MTHYVTPKENGRFKKLSGKMFVKYNPSDTEKELLNVYDLINITPMLMTEKYFTLDEIKHYLIMSGDTRILTVDTISTIILFFYEAIHGDGKFTNDPVKFIRGYVDETHQKKKIKCLKGPGIYFVYDGHETHLIQISKESANREYFRTDNLIGVCPIFGSILEIPLVHEIRAQRLEPSIDDVNTFKANIRKTIERRYNLSGYDTNLMEYPFEQRIVLDELDLLLKGTRVISKDLPIVNKIVGIKDLDIALIVKNINSY